MAAYGMSAAMSERRTRLQGGGGPRAVGDLTARVSGAAFRRFGFQQSQIVARWAEIVGPDFARHAQPQALRLPHGKRLGGVLHLTVTGAYAPQLAMVEAEIVERVNRFFGHAAVARLHMVHGTPMPPRAVSVAAAEPPPVPRALEGSLREIADPDLKASLTALARQIGVSRGSPVFD
jgi:hypothetical protein